MTNTEPMADVVAVLRETRDLLVAVKRHPDYAPVQDKVDPQIRRVDKVLALASRPTPSEASGDVVEALRHALTNLEISEKGHIQRADGDFLRGIEGARRHIREALSSLTPAPQADALREADND